MPSAADLEKAFKVFDTDNSGTLSASELIKILTRPGGAALTMADAEELIQRVDVNGDGELDLEEFCTLMSDGGDISMVAPPADSSSCIAAFEEATKSVKKTSPVLALFKQIAERDPSLKALELHEGRADGNAANMEWSMWPDKRKAAALALLHGATSITTVNLAGCNLNDSCAKALASALGADSTIEKLNLERNKFAEAGLLELINGLKENAVLRELRLTGNSTPITTAVEVGFAELLDGGGASALTKLSPEMRNANERRRVEAAISRNMDALRKKRNAAK